MEEKAERKAAPGTKASAACKGGKQVQHKAEGKQHGLLGGRDHAAAEAKVEAEWEAMLRNAPQEGGFTISDDPEAQRILDGFKINWMNMRDAMTGELKWQSSDWGGDMFTKEKEGEIELVLCDLVVIRTLCLRLTPPCSCVCSRARRARACT